MIFFIILQLFNVLHMYFNPIAWTWNLYSTFGANEKNQLQIIIDPCLTYDPIVAS
jgi:hypothetical protein